MKELLRKQEIYYRADSNKNNWQPKWKRIIRTVTLYTNQYGYSATIRMNGQVRIVRQRYDNVWDVIA